MSLRDDVSLGLAELSLAPNLPELTLDESGWCRIPIPIPPALIELRERQLVLEIQVSHTGKFFSILTPLAIIEGQPKAAIWESLLHRQFHADQVSSASFAISVADDFDVLVAIYHWMLDSITPREFSELYQRFISATFDLIGETNELAQRASNIHPIHRGRI